MLAAAARLDRGQTGEPTQTAARAALDRLTRLAKALQTDPSAGQSPEGQSEPQSESQTQQPPGDGITSLAELKLLRLMQEELNRRTASLDAARQKQGELSPEQEQQLANCLKSKAAWPNC